MATDALAAVDRPPPRPPLLGVVHHRLVAGRVRAEPAAALDLFVAGHHLDLG
jgi:hypothetical protein